LAGELFRAKDDHREAFWRYEDRLRPFIQSKQKSARNFARSFAPRSALGVWIRNQATKLMTIPQAANLLVLGELRDIFELPDNGM
jgi:2-polyprenyl-6-methoxyphenol hydroxylase-like FAD-dependent oxidoreductase